MTTQTITLQIRDGAPLPVVGAFVMLLSSSGVILATGRTGTDGNISFALVQNGSYTLNVRAQGYTFVDSAVEVADTGVAQTFTRYGVNLGLTAPPPTSRCVIYGFVQTNGVVDPEVWVDEGPSVLTSPNGSGVNPDKVFEVGCSRRARVSAGRWEAESPVGGFFRVRIPAIGMQKTIVVPNQTTASIVDVHGIQKPSISGVSGDTATTGSVISR